MYDTTLPYLIHALKTLDTILTRAEKHCEDNKIKPEALLNYQLFPNMFSFTKQVQLCSDFVKGCAARLSRPSRWTVQPQSRSPSVLAVTRKRR
jgi:uncharacterized protein